MQPNVTRAWVEVDLDALRRNAAALAARCPALLPMVKADGYGLGAVPVARALEAIDPWGFGVATLAEGTELRRAGIARRVIVFTPVALDELAALARLGLIPVLAGGPDLDEWRRVGGGDWHLEIDTGMSRAGVRWDAVAGIAGALRACPPQGAFTHFHSSELDDGSVALQTERFEQAIAQLPARPPLLHAENSAALARVPRSRWDLVRPGVFLYGVACGSGTQLVPEPVAQVRSRVVSVRDVLPGETVSYDATWRATAPSRIATLAIGYADGWRRSFGNRAAVLIRGRRAPVAGVVTMDMTMVDVTGTPCETGDVATLIGSDGGDRITVEQAAEAAGLSPYEVLTGLRGRLERVYVGASPQ